MPQEDDEKQQTATEKQPNDDLNDTPADVTEEGSDDQSEADAPDAEQDKAEMTTDVQDSEQSTDNENSTPDEAENDNQMPDLPDFSGMLVDAAASSIELLNDVELNVKIELGRAEMTVDEILQLSNGSVVELNKLAGDPVDVLVNEQLIAHGEVLVVNDNFCVRINEIVPGISERVTNIEKMIGEESTPGHSPQDQSPEPSAAS